MPSPSSFVLLIFMSAATTTSLRAPFIPPIPPPCPHTIARTEAPHPSSPPPVVCTSTMCVCVWGGVFTRAWHNFSHAVRGRKESPTCTTHTTTVDPRVEEKIGGSERAVNRGSTSGSLPLLSSPLLSSSPPSYSASHHAMDGGVLYMALLQSRGPEMRWKQGSQCVSGPEDGSDLMYQWPCEEGEDEFSFFFRIERLRPFKRRTLLTSSSSLASKASAVSAALEASSSWNGGGGG